jgi:hypothetical protein
MTPQEIIRAQPFRYAAHMTEADEAWVAAQMFRAITKEQRNNDNTPGRVPNQPTRLNQSVEVSLIETPGKIRQKSALEGRIRQGLQRRKDIIECLKHGPMSVEKLHAMMAERGQNKTTPGSLRDFMKLMAKEGYTTCVKMTDGTVSRGFWSWTGEEVKRRDVMIDEAEAEQ